MSNKNNYGFKESLKLLSDELLVARFNQEVGNPGWVTARGYFLSEIVALLESRGIDCKLIKFHNGISIQNKVKLRDKNLII